MALSPGDRLGSYEIEALLGVGGMGEVYRGRDSRLGRHVALKVIAPSLVGEASSRKRFETEARAASALNHPSIVTIYDIGDSGGVSWMAMEWIEGRSLREALRDGPLRVRDAWSIAKQIADGLAAAHAKGIVHRDLKPENVMLTGDGRAKILDFGLARQNIVELPEGASALATALEPRRGRTLAGTIVGTVGYMSPEQAAGHRIDFTSDQFSFGVLLYELLTGCAPFAQSTSMETLASIMRDDPAPISTRRRETSEAFDRVIARCLAKRREERFGTTRELVTALEVLNPESSGVQQAGVETATSPSSTALPATRTPSHRVRARALVAIGAAAAIAIAPYAWNHFAYRPAPAITSLAVLPFANAADDPEAKYLGDGLTESLISHLSRAASLKVMARATVMRFEGTKDPSQAGRTLGVGAVVTGRVQRRAGQVLILAELIDSGTGERLWGETYDRPFADFLSVQDSIVSAIADGLRLRLSGQEKARLGGGYGTDNLEAYELYLKGHFLMGHDTEEDDLEARKLFEQAVAIDPRFVEAYIAVVAIHARAAGNGYASPRQELAAAGEAIEAARAIAPNHIAVRSAAVTNRFQTTRDWATAEREYRALANDPEIIRDITFHGITVFLVAVGRPEEAAALTERALVLDPRNVESRNMLGSFLMQAGRLDDALKVYNAISESEPEDPRAYFGIADIFKQRGDIARAAQARRKAYELEADTDGARLFAAALTEKDYEKADVTLARAQLEEQRQAAKQRYVSPLDLARLHAMVGDREAAFAALEQAMADPPVGLTLLKVDPAWNSIRTDPRFAAIVRRVGIP